MITLDDKIVRQILKHLDDKHGYQQREKISQDLNIDKSELIKYLDYLWKQGYIGQEYGQQWAILPKGKDYLLTP